MDGAGERAPARAERGPVDLFPLAWTGFLLASTGFTVMRAGPPMGLPISAARTPARDLLAVIALGVTILWPMLRLSRPPVVRGSTGAVAPVIVADAFIVVAPSIAVVLAMQALIRWGWGPTIAVCALFLSWTLLIGGAIALASAARAGRRRSLVMALIVASSLGAPALLWLAEPASIGAALALCSPVTGVYALTASADGAPLGVGASAWAIVVAPLVPATLLWSLAAGNQPGGRLDSGEGATRPAGPTGAPHVSPDTRDAGTPGSAAFFSSDSGDAPRSRGAPSDVQGP